MQSLVIFRQLFDTVSSTYTYILGCPNTHEAIIIDPVRDQAQRDLQLLNELGVKLKYTIDTHIHADHITGSGILQQKTDAKIVMGIGAKVAQPDILLHDNQILTCGSLSLRALSTPGHTNGCMSLSILDMIFTGDTLLIRKTGRTDFQQGSTIKLYESILQKLYILPDNTRVFPGHDYHGYTESSIGEEKKYNKRIQGHTLLSDFEITMNALHLEYPKHIDIALPANMLLGR